MTTWDRIVDWIIGYGGQVAGAVVILAIGWIGGRLIRRLVRRLLARGQVAPAVTAFCAQLSFVVVLVAAVIASLARFGIETTSFVALLGAVGFAIGFALQGALSNFAAGVLLLVQHPFRIGDFVEAAGVSGTVQDIQLFTTILATPDNVKVIVPNAKIYGNTIRNYAGYDTRRIDLVVGIGYGASIKEASSSALELMQGDRRILKEPAPQVLVTELADSSVNLTLRMWAASTDYWDVRFDLTRSIKLEFDVRGIEIPFPQTVVHVARGEEDSGST